MLNYTDVLFYIFYDKFWDKTPRQKYNTYISMRGMSWGKLFPKYGNFVIIGKPSVLILSRNGDTKFSQRLPTHALHRLSLALQQLV